MIGLFLDALVHARGEDVLRIKGVLNLEGQDRPLVVRGVQHMRPERLRGGILARIPPLRWLPAPGNGPIIWPA